MVVAFCCLHSSTIGNTVDDIKTPRCRSAGVFRLGAWQLDHYLDAYLYMPTSSTHIPLLTYTTCYKFCVNKFISRLGPQGQMLQT
jgi:hypothetical protein